MCVNSDFIQPIGLVFKSYKATWLTGLEDSSVGTRRRLIEKKN